MMAGGTPATAEPPQPVTTTKVTGSTTTRTTIYTTNTFVPSLRILGPVHLVDGQANLNVMVACGAGGSISFFGIVSQDPPSQLGNTTDLSNPVRGTCTGEPQLLTLLLYPYPDGSTALAPGPARLDLLLDVSGLFAVAGTVYVNDSTYRVV
jgi:hypothetical protein